MKKSNTKKTNKKNTNSIWNNKFLQLVICLLIAVIIYFILVIITNSNSFQGKSLNSNTNAMFSMSDLSIKNAVYGDLISTVETEFGKPRKIDTFKENKNNYKVYYYDGAQLTFKEVGGSYILMKVKVTSKGYLVSRDIQIGDNVNDVMNKYLIIDTKGEYLYGNHKEDEINGKKVKDNVYFGKREKNLVYYLYMDSPYASNHIESDSPSLITLCS